MKILILAPENNQLRPISQSIFNEWREIGGDYELEMLESNNFYCKSTYFQRKLCKLGYKAAIDSYDKNLVAELEKKCAAFQPNCILILNGSHLPEAVLKFLKRYKTIAWLWDSFRRGQDLNGVVEMSDEIFCFEHADLEYLSGKNKFVHYLPLGADTKIYYPRNLERDIDISFVGLASERRIDYLNKVCARAAEKNWRVKIGGVFYDKSHFWKKYIFRFKQSHLARYLDNRIFTPAEVAELYCRSKICVNINTTVHRSLSPRTFEICATKSFQLMNGGQDSQGLMNLETDLATFDGVEDLLEKIEFYLANEELRKKIAAAGFDAVMKNCTMKKSVGKLLAESEIVRACRK